MEAYFRLTYSLNGMHIDRADRLPFKIIVSTDVPYEIEFWIRKFADPKVPEQLCCSVIFRQVISKKQADNFKTLFSGYLPLSSPPQLELPYRLSSTGMIDIDGKIPDRHSLPARLLPSSMRDVFSGSLIKAGNLIKGYIKTLRWVDLTSGNHNPFAHVDFKWSLDGDNWQNVPTSGQLSGNVALPISTDLAVHSLIVSTILDGQTEPLSHELIREALAICSSSPRSSLLISITALESGLKQYLSWLIPGVNSLLDEFQSPPIVKLLQDVIPKLHQERQINLDKFPLEKVQIDEFKKWILLRNRIAHGVEQEIDQHKLKNFLALTRQILYRLDVCMGRGWAEEFSANPNPENFWGPNSDSSGVLTIAIG